MAIFGTLICWSSTPIWIKYFAGFFDPFSQNFYRYAFALLFWLPLLIVRQMAGRIPRTVWIMALFSSIPNTAMQTFWAWSLYYLDAGLMSLMGRTTVIWSAFLSIAVFADERPLLRSRIFWMGMICGMAGAVGVLVFKGGFDLRAASGGSASHTILIGVIMSIAAAVLWAVYAVAVRLTMRDVNSVTAFAVIAFQTTVGCGVISLIWGRPADVVNVPWHVIVLVALSGWICIALAHVSYYDAIHRIGVAIPTAVLQLTPFFVVCLSYLIFHEEFTLGQLGSGVVLVIGSMLGLWAQRDLGQQRPPPPAAEAGD